LTRINWGDCKTRNETETKRNETKKIINKYKNETNINKTVFCCCFFYMRQQSIKCQWRIEKPLKFTRSFGYGRKQIIRISYFNFTNWYRVVYIVLFHVLLGDRFMVWVSTVLKTMGWLCWPSLPGEGICYQSIMFLLFYESQKFT
jgi:hypothetical protein